MPQMMLAKAWLVAARGSDRGAVDAARRAADAAHSAGQYALEAEALHHAARFGIAPWVAGSNPCAPGCTAR